MAAKDDLLTILKDLYNNRFFPKPDYIRGLLGDGNGNIAVPGRPDYNFARFNRGSSRVFEVFNKEVNPVDGWPILIGEFPWQPGLTQVVGTDWSAYEQTGWGDDRSSVDPHSPTHEWPDGQPGSDPVNVYPRAIVPGKAYVDSTGSTSLFVAPFYYEHASTGTFWPGTPALGLGSNINNMASGTAQFLGIYHNPASNTLHGVTGTIGVSSAALDPPKPQFPAGVTPLTFVKVSHNQGGIGEASIRDARRWLGPQVPTGPASGDLTGTYPHPNVSGLYGFPILGPPTDNKRLHYTGSAWHLIDPDVAGPAGGGGSSTITVKNTSGAAASANDVGYIDDAGEYKTTTTAQDLVSWCVVTTGGANNVDIEVVRRGRVSINYTGTAPSAGDYLVTSTTAGQAQQQTTMRPEVFAVCTAAGSGGSVEALLLTGTVFIPSSLGRIFSVVDHDTTDFVSTINGPPGTSAIIYNAPSSGNENVLIPASTSYDVYAVLHNTTRGDSALILDVDTGLSRIIFTGATPGSWQSGDSITIRSQTLTTASAQKPIDLDLSALDIPVLARSIKIVITAFDTGISANAQTYLHPYDGNFDLGKAKVNNVQEASKFHRQFVTVSLYEQKMAWGSLANASNTHDSYFDIEGVEVAVP